MKDCREFVLAVSDSPPIRGRDYTNSVNAALRDRRDIARELYGFESKGMLSKIHVHVSNCDSLKRFGENFFGDGAGGIGPNLGRCRMWVSSCSPIAVDTNAFADNKNFVVVSVAGADSSLGWHSAHPSSGVFAEVVVPKSAHRSFLPDFAFDIILANGPVLAPVLDRAIAAKGRYWLYEQKADFARNRLPHDRSVYGKVSPEASYAAFAAVMRAPSGKGGDSEWLGAVCTAWDDFVMDRLPEFVPDRDERATLLRSWPGEGGQLGNKEISALLDTASSPGPWLVFRVSGTPKGAQIDQVKGLGFRKPQRGETMIYRANGPLSHTMRQLISNGTLSAMRFYVK